jgi:hypothetical protein
MALAGVMRTCCPIVGRQDPMAPSVDTTDLRAESVHSRPPSCSRPARRPAVISRITGSGLTGRGCRRAGSKAAVPPWPTGPDPA